IVSVVRGGLVIPFQAAGPGVEREDRRGIEIVPAALFAVVVRPRISGCPVERVEFGIEGAGEPGDAAGMLDGLAAPGLRARLARLGNCPEAPDLLTGLRIEGGQEAARALFAAGGS